MILIFWVGLSTCRRAHFRFKTHPQRKERKHVGNRLAVLHVFFGNKKLVHKKVYFAIGFLTVIGLGQVYVSIFTLSLMFTVRYKSYGLQQRQKLNERIAKPLKYHPDKVSGHRRMSNSMQRLC